MIVTKDRIEMQGRSVKDMEALTRLSERVQKPHETCVGTSGIRTTGYGEQGESNALLWGAAALAAIGLGALGRWAYKKFGKGSEPIQALPAPSPSVEEVEFEEVPENESREEDELPKEEEASKRKPWGERFQDEFGPLPELPPMLQFVVERSPAGYEVAMTVTLLCAFAALCFSKVRAKYLDGKVHAPNLQVLVEGNWGAGKEKFMTALNALFKRLFDRDKEKFLSTGEGKIIQCAGISATESKFIDIMSKNGGVHVLMVSSEVLAAVNNMRKQNGLTAEYYRKAFDNGEVYRGNRSKDAQGLFKVFMNYIMTGTPGDTAKFISKELEGGTASRICWIAIPDSGRYLEALVIEDSEELEAIRDQIDLWNKTYCYDHDESSGFDLPAEESIIDLGYVNTALKTWIEDDQWAKANCNIDDPRIGARGRMAAIGHHLAMVIHMLYGCPGPDMVQTRRKVVDLTMYLTNYCMERFLFKFGDIQKVQRELNNQAERVENTTTVDKEAQQSSPQPDEKNYCGGLSKSTVKKMYEMYIPGKVGYGTIAKYFGLPGENGQQKVKRAIKKYKQELDQK
jgi:hypothetical protein